MVQMILNFVIDHLYNINIESLRYIELDTQNMCKFYKVYHELMYIKYLIPIMNMTIEHVLLTCVEIRNYWQMPWTGVASMWACKCKHVSILFFPVMICKSIRACEVPWNYM